MTPNVMADDHSKEGSVNVEANRCRPLDSLGNAISKLRHP